MEPKEKPEGLTQKKKKIVNKAFRKSYILHNLLFKHKNKKYYEDKKYQQW